MKKIQMVDLRSQYDSIKADVNAGIQEVLDTTTFIKGGKVNVFQKNLEEYLGVKHVIPVGNGTDALQISLMALGLKPGDEVITPTFTFIATAEVVALLGLTPVVVDVDFDTFNISIDAIKKAITPRTKAIVPVHLFGQCADMENIMKIAKENKERVWDFIIDYVNSDKPYDIRFAVVMMLCYFIDEEHTPEMLRLFQNIKHEDYYVKMAVAWAVSSCYVNQTKVILPFLKDNMLDDFTYNKSLQKICESLKPSAEEKAMIREMKRRATKKYLQLLPT